MSAGFASNTTERWSTDKKRAYSQNPKINNANTSMKNNQYRQGDVMLQRIETLPSNLKPVTPEDGKVILAHGEVTGHHHSFSAAAAERLTDDTGSEYFRVTGTPLKGEFPIVRQWNNQVMINHPEHGMIEFYTGDICVIGDTVKLDGNYGLLTHQEHNTHGIPAGFYIGGGASGKVRQREYSPEAIRNVAD